jgi:prepilin-type N-terminal cleavage/methylation domain-containing protein
MVKMRTSITINLDCLGNRRYGFTVVELMVVVIIIVMLASAMGGYYVGTYKRMQVEDVARQIMLAAKYARLFAVEKQSSCSLVMDEKEKSFCLIRGDFQEDVSQADQAVVSNSYTRPGRLEGDIMFEKVEVTSSGQTDAGIREDQSMVIFRRDGTADTAVIQVGDGKNHYTVYISAATGKAKVESDVAGESSIDIVDLDMEAY